MLDDVRQLIAQGDLSRAEGLLQSLLDKEQHNAEAHHLLGMVEQKRGDQDKAIPLLRHAIELDPDHAVYHNNLGHSLRLTGDLRGARTAFQQATRLQPDFPLAWLNLGIVQYHLADLAAARRALEQALQHNPRLAGAMHYLGLVQLAEGDTDAARGSFENALHVHAGIVESDLELARLDARGGDLRGALARLQRITRQRPDLALAWRLMGELLVTSGQEVHAEHSFRRALANSPDDADTWGALGDALMRQGRYEQALEAFDRVLELDPGMARAHGFRAGCFERLHRLDEAEQAIAAALAIDPDLAEVRVQQAALAQRRDALPRAREILETVQRRDDLYDDLRLSVEQQLGVVLDRLDEPEAAFRAFRAANEIAGRLADHVSRKGMFSEDWLDTIGAWITRTDWSRLAAAPGRFREAFLVGFPRSGTTLLGQVLSAHSGIRTLDEKPLLQPFLNRHAANGAALDALTRMEDTQLDPERESYRQAVREEIPDADQARVVVDKMPLYSTVIGPVRFLFPGARFVVSLRDPRDVCLSCFMQNFRLNTAMLPFLDLESTAEYYSRVMDLVIQYLELFPDHVHVVRYEDLVDDLETAATGLFEHLGLAWEEDVTRFYENAREQAIHTPSYRQVTEPLYARAAGRWRRYREQLAPVLPRLQPYVERFGYR